MSRDKYPTMRGPSSECRGAVLTREILESGMRKMADRSKDAEHQEYSDAKRKAYVEYAKSTYAKYLGVAELTPEQEKQMWDGISDAWWRYMCKTTNIEEWIG